jgi:hypothetical protein
MLPAHSTAHRGIGEIAARIDPAVELNVVVVHRLADGSVGERRHQGLSLELGRVTPI